MGALRTITVWLLMLVASGMIPAAAICAQGTDECGEVCARCWCKRFPPGSALRAPCACCQPSPGMQPVTLLPPAVLPASSPSLGPAPEGCMMSVVTAAPGLFAASVPHPPPRTRLLF